jgi:hypothetical protein
MTAKFSGHCKKKGYRSNGRALRKWQRNDCQTIHLDNIYLRDDCCCERLRIERLQRANNEKRKKRSTMKVMVAGNEGALLHEIKPLLRTQQDVHSVMIVLHYYKQEKRGRGRGDILWCG